MEQHEFIWMANNMGIGIVTQDESGHTEANLRPNIYITHDYNGNNLMLLTFKETREFYKIKTKDELEEIFRLHLTNENLEVPLRAYATESLKQII
jgi:hypothetical protein